MNYNDQLVITKFVNNDVKKKRQKIKTWSINKQFWTLNGGFLWDLYSGKLSQMINQASFSFVNKK